MLHSLCFIIYSLFFIFIYFSFFTIYYVFLLLHSSSGLSNICYTPSFRFSCFQPFMGHPLKVHVEQNFNAFAETYNIMERSKQFHIRHLMHVISDVMVIKCYVHVSGFHSLALLFAGDATYRFIYRNVGIFESEGDCNILRIGQ